MLNGPTHIPASPTRALLLLHGFGSNGDDLSALIPAIEDELPEDARNKTAYFSPNAPLDLPFGGHAWFSDNNWTFRDREGIETAKNMLWDYLEKNIFPLNLTARDITVFGFSQGAMTALFAAPRWPECVGKIIAHSGRMFWQEELTGSAYHTPPTLILHGEDDDVVVPKGGAQATQGLQHLGFNVTHKTFPNLAHGINQPSLQTFVQWWL